MAIEIGSRVRIIGNAKNTCWETGIVSDIYEGYVWVRYGFPIYGMSRAIETSRLELLKEDD